LTAGEAPPAFEVEPRRIVSLVPSLTEALFALGLGARVVGVTDWCVHPAGVAGLPKVGGTKDTDVAAVIALEPDLVIANREENTRRTVERLRAAGLAVWVTYPRTVEDAVRLLRELGRLGASRTALDGVVGPIERAIAVARAERARAAPSRVFCPIWRDPWLTIGADTYAHDLVALCGGANVFADRGDRRYPRISLDDVSAAQPEVILLPDEPYRFGDADARELARLDVPAARHARIHCVDGTWVSWYGPRIQTAIEGLRPLLAPSGAPVRAP
jgi:ABC-type Fe3+-hydroxamate transport system substrate-binding protein